MGHLKLYAVYLSALLIGKALKIYSRLEDSAAKDYTKIKQALFKTYNLTEEGFREKFRKSKSEHDESPQQYFTRLETYCNGWFETIGASTYEEIKSLIVREQFLDMCPQSLTVHLKERSFTSVTHMCTQADRFLQAHKQKLFDNQGRWIATIKKILTQRKTRNTRKTAQLWQIRTYSG